MPMMVMPRTQWNARERLPQLDDVFRIIFSPASRLYRPAGRPGILFASTMTGPDSFPFPATRFESFQIFGKITPVAGRLPRWAHRRASKTTEW
jgi:hypothetical protein